MWIPGVFPSVFSEAGKSDSGSGGEMAQTATGDTAAQKASSVPWAGAAVASLTVLAGAGVSLWLWPELPEAVPSGKAGFDGEPALAPRWLFATAMPGTVLSLVAVLLAGLRTGARFQRELRIPAFWSGRGARRLMDLFLVLTSGFMLATHAVVLHSEAGRDLPLSADRLLALLMAGFVVCFGLLAPLLRAGSGQDTVAARWWDRARWPVGVGLMLVGAVTGLVGFLAPGTLWAALTGLLMVPAILLGCAFPFTGNQEWKNRPRSSR
jgi:hypothetical protein